MSLTIFTQRNFVADFRQANYDFRWKTGKSGEVFIPIYSVLLQCTRLADRQTDEQTDGQTPFLLLVRAGIPRGKTFRFVVLIVLRIFCISICCT